MKGQSTLFDESFSQNTFVIDELVTNTNVNFVQMDKIRDTDLTTIDSTISFTSGSGGGRIMEISQGTTLNKSFWKRRRVPSGHLMLKLRVGHSQNNSFGLSILGTLITMTTSGVVSISGGPSMTLQNYTVNTKTVWRIRVYNKTLGLQIEDGQFDIYTMTYNIPNPNESSPVGFGTGKYYRFDIRLMKSLLGLHLIGSDLISSRALMGNILGINQLLDKNIQLNNQSTINANFVNGMLSQMTTVINTKLDKGTTIAVLVLDLNQLNNVPINPVETYIDDINSMVDILISNDIQVWITTCLPKTVLEKPKTDQINEAMAFKSNIKVIDLNSKLTDPTTGLLRNDYYIQSFTEQGMILFADILVGLVYDTLDSEQYLERLNAVTLYGTKSPLVNQSIFQSDTPLNTEFAGIFNNSILLNSSEPLILFHKNGNNNVNGLPDTSGVRSNSTKHIYHSNNSTFDLSRGVHGNGTVLWDSANEYRLFSNGVETLRNTNNGLSLLHNILISNTVNPIETTLATLNVKGDVFIKGKSFTRTTTFGTPTVLQRSTGTTHILKSSITSSTCDTALGLGDSTGSLWLSSPGSIQMFQNNIETMTLNSNGMNILNRFTLLPSSGNSKTEWIMGFPNTNYTPLQVSQVYRKRIDNVNDFYFEKVNTVSSIDIVYRLSTDFQGKLISYQSIFNDYLKQNTIFNIVSNSVNTGFTQTGRIQVSNSSITSGGGGYTFTLLNNYITSNSTIHLTLSSTNDIPLSGLGSGNCIVRHSNISTGQCHIAIVLISSNTFASNVIVHFTIQ